MAKAMRKTAGSWAAAVGRSPKVKRTRQLLVTSTKTQQLLVTSTRTLELLRGDAVQLPRQVLLPTSCLLEAISLAFSQPRAGFLARQLCSLLLVCSMRGCPLSLQSSLEAFTQLNSTASPVRAATPPPPSAPSTQVAMPPAVDDERSEDMEDDELVMAYVTPPASPAAAATASASPGRTRPSLGKRRRAADSRTVRRAVAPGASSGVAGTQEESVTVQDVLDALRSGLSSVRREITRFRGELVVV